MAASLAGLDAALERRDELDAELAVRRLLVALRRRVRVSRASADLDGRRARAAQRPRLGGRAGARRRQPLDASPEDGLGRRGPAAPAQRRRKGGRGPGCGGSSTRGARSGRCTATASRGPCRDRRRARVRAGPRARRRAPAAARELQRAPPARSPGPARRARRGGRRAGGRAGRPAAAHRRRHARAGALSARVVEDGTRAAA